MDWVDILSRFGFPTAMVAVLCFAILVSCRWAAKNVVTPLVESHLSFMRQLQSYLVEHTGLKKSHVALTQSIQAEIKLQTEMLREIHSRVGKGGSCNYPATGTGKQLPG